VESEEVLQERLLKIFENEAVERLNTLTSGLLGLEKAKSADDRAKIVETIYREAHSLKGAARSVNKKDIETVCQSLENVLAGIKQEKIPATSQTFDALYKVVDGIGALLETPLEILEEGRRPCTSELVRMLDYISPAPSGKAKPGKDRTAFKKPISEKIKSEKPVIEKPIEETVRIDVRKLDSLFRQTEEMLSVKLAAAQRLSDLRYLKHTFAQWGREWSKDSGKHTKPVGITANRKQCKKFVESIDRQLAELVRGAESGRQTLETMVNSLLEDAKKLLLFPVSFLFESLPKMVRDISREQGKEVGLVIEGDEIEMDKRILAEMKIPLIHLVRNCIDHGLEEPQERKLSNKPIEGKITITVSHVDSDKVQIVVSDDGAGIDPERMKEEAVKKGLLSRQEANKLSRQDALSLIFNSGFSTSPIITRLSGRGLGLAIVRESVEKLGGSVFVNPEPSRGAEIGLLIPVTLATFRGIVVRAGGMTFVIPAVNVEVVARVKKRDIKKVANRETISLNGSTVSFVRLEDVLELSSEKGREEESEFIHLLVLTAEGRRVAFGVGEIINEQEVLVKNLGPRPESAEYTLKSEDVGIDCGTSAFSVKRIFK